PEIAPGDRVAMIQTWPAPVWLRSSDLAFKSFAVEEKYHDKIHGSWVRPNCALCHRKQYPLSIGPPLPLSGRALLGYAALVAGGVVIVAAAEALWLPTINGQGPSDLSIADRESIR